MRATDRRATEAISAYLARVSGAPDAEAMASVIGAATRAAGCALSVADEQYVWGAGAGEWARYQVDFGGEPQGVLAVAPASVGPLPNLVAALGAPLLAVRFAVETERLRRAGDADARKLIDHRWRATVEMEQERRSLERDLHDGAQHHLVALRMMLALAEHSHEAIRERLPDLLTRLDTAERVLVDTAAGVLPLALADDGLAAGLAAELDDHDDVTLDIGDLRRTYSPVVEAAVYFTCLEAVNNAHKHAPGASISVKVGDSDRGLEFAVSDTGPGFADPAQAAGMHDLRSRITAVSGEINISSSSTGTTVSGYVPR